MSLLASSLARSSSSGVSRRGCLRRGSGPNDDQRLSSDGSLIQSVQGRSRIRRCPEAVPCPLVGDDDWMVRPRNVLEELVSRVSGKDAAPEVVVEGEPAPPEDADGSAVRMLFDGRRQPREVP